MRIIGFLFLGFLFFDGELSAQQKKVELDSVSWEVLHTYEDTLALLSYAVVNDSLAENRFAATKALIETLVTALKVKGSYAYPFDRLQSVSVVYPADSTFRIFTWQLYVDRDKYKYYGAIQKASNELELIPFIDRSEQVDDMEGSILGSKSWYGALYYNVIKFGYGENRKYALFGYDAYNFFDRRKVVDVLTFNEAGDVVFGAPVFFLPNQVGELVPQNRFYLQYTSEASVVCNFDVESRTIVYNHLIPLGASSNGEPKYIPSGSFDGLRLEGGEWKYVEELYKFDTPVNEYPRPSPVLDDRNKRDLFGN